MRRRDLFGALVAAAAGAFTSGCSREEQKKPKKYNTKGVHLSLLFRDNLIRKQL